MYIIGIGGITLYTSSKLQQRALLWGMYIRSQYCGNDVANSLMSSFINYATDVGIERVLLTVVSSNLNAIHFYEKWKFRSYAIDPFAVKLNNEEYLDEMLMVRCI